jgi:hypothetical protein
MYKVSKINAAVFQLDWAIKLFLDEKAYVSSITLAGAAEEILGEAIADSMFRTMKTKLEEVTRLEGKVISQEYLNKTKNWLKHWRDLKDDEVVEIDLETESIHYILRAMGNLVRYDNSVSSETTRFYQWLLENINDLFSDL